MQYHIDTIPVWDAYKLDSECPLCDLRKANEQRYVESFLGASVMEPDVRIEVNRKGFCGPHFAMLFAQKNRLGLALMTHTHLQETMGAMGDPVVSKAGLFGKKKASATQMKHDGETCVLCERLEATMNRYAYTVLHLYKTDTAFRAALEGSKGLCLPHYHQLIEMAPRAMGGPALKGFLSMLARLEQDNLGRVEKELEWFTLKFDYRNAEAPWGNSRDAVERAINKLRGKCV